MDRIILASSSPRRQELLSQFDIPFEVILGNVDEGMETEISPYAFVKSLAAKKCRAVASMVSGDAIIIAADTIVTSQGKIIGKPSDVEDAFRILKYLRGSKHSVYTGMTVIFKKNDELEQIDIIDSADVHMRKFTDDEIWAYIHTGEPMDKAGAYAIQGRGTFLIEKIDGDYNTIKGLPFIKLYELLKNRGFELTEYWTR